jgi:hypothetical protein
MASAVQERRQAPADGPGRTGKKDPVTHHRYSVDTVRPSGRCTAKCFPITLSGGRAIVPFPRSKSGAR